MTKNPKHYWKLVRVPSFKTDFEKLNPYGKWLVGKIIESMLQTKDPVRTYCHVTCDEYIPDLYLFGVLDDGVGNKKFGLQIYLDKEKKILFPITICEQ